MNRKESSILHHAGSDQIGATNEGPWKRRCLSVHGVRWTGPDGMQTVTCLGDLAWQFEEEESCREGGWKEGG